MRMTHVLSQSVGVPEERNGLTGRSITANSGAIAALASAGAVSAVAVFVVEVIFASGVHAPTDPTIKTHLRNVPPSLPPAWLESPLIGP